MDREHTPEGKMKKNLDIDTSNKNPSKEKQKRRGLPLAIRSFNHRENEERIIIHQSLENSFEESILDNSRNPIREDLTPNHSQIIINSPLSKKKESLKKVKIYKKAKKRGEKRTQKLVEIKEEYKEKSRFICTFCGGKKCKHENWKLIKNPAIKGLNSNFITDDIIASQRLSKRLMKEYKIVNQFLDMKVKAVFNLQEPGEHKRCGDGLIEGKAFSYDFDDLGKCKIFRFILNLE